MKAKGRPRILSLDKEIFVNLYLNPLMSVEQICQICNVKKSTFYNYEKELGFAQLRVGVGSLNANLPRKKALESFNSPDEIKELNVIRRLGKLLRARIKIIPVLSNDVRTGLQAVESKDVDFVIASLSKTKERQKSFYFSDNYIFDESPNGVLFRNPALISLHKTASDKPTLGVPTSTIHSEYADENLSGEFQIQHFNSGRRAFMALQEGTLDYVLTHPMWMGYCPEETQGLEICSKPYLYKSHPGMVFHADSEHWRKPVNEALQIMQFEFEAKKKV